MNNQPEIPAPAPTDTGEGGASAASSCSALSDSLALVDLGARRDADAITWTAAAQKMCRHCEGGETVDEAAARIIATEYRKALAALTAIEEIYSYGRCIEDDFTAMGNLARDYVCPPNAEGEATPPVTPTHP